MLSARRMIPVVGTLAAVAVLPSSAVAAGTIIRDSTTYVYVPTAPPPGDPVPQESVRVDIVTGSPPTLRFDSFGIGTSGAGCSDGGNFVTCPVTVNNVPGGTPITKVELRGSSEGDSLQARIEDEAISVVLDGKDGDDFLFGGAYYTNGSDAPVTLLGGDGNDSMYGGMGPDTFDGGPGNDFMTGFAGTDVLIGGSGFDAVSHWDRFNASDHLVLSNNGIADDGADVNQDGVSEENDNIGADVEDMYGGSGNDRIIGNAAANTLDGGNGNDLIEGGAGFDTFSAGDGNDTILSRDGRSERIDCGEGTDSSTTDTSDTTSSCETDDASEELESDVDKDGVSKPADCNDKDAAIHPGAVDTPNNGVDEDCNGVDNTQLDRDGDSFAPPADCDDNNPAISPAAREIYGNKVDEDCNQKADPLLAITSPVLTSFRPSRRGARITNLRVLSPPVGSVITITCRGKGCKFKLVTVPVTKVTRLLNLTRQLKRSSLKKRAVVEVRIMRPDSVGRVERFRIVGGKDVRKRQTLCMAPTDKAPRKC